MVSRLTYLTICTNEVQFIDTPQRSECWIVKDGRPHALQLSCPLDKRKEMEELIASWKVEYEEKGIPQDL